MALARFAILSGLLIAVGLAACAGTPLTTDVTFAPGRPIPVRASAVEVKFAPGADAGSAQLDFEPALRLADLPGKWAEARLSATGGPGRVTILVTEATFEDRKLERKGGLSGLFSIEPSEEFETRLAVRATFQDGEGFAAAGANVRASATVPEHASNAQRQAIYAKLIQDVAATLDAELSGQIRDHFPYRAFVAP